MSASSTVRVAGALVVLALVAGGCSAKDVQKKESDSLPDVTLQPFDTGDALELAQLRGPTVVNLWASWCGPCRRELPQYEAFARKYAGKVKVIGIDFQDTQHGKASQLIEDTGVTYPLYRDPDGDLRARGLPQVILVDEDGHRAYEKYVEITSVAQLEKLVQKHLGVS